jgi:adenosyl cobinamide kinase/adenosyl cobinamide phosphate guanylyltransferase
MVGARPRHVATPRRTEDHQHFPVASRTVITLVLGGSRSGKSELAEGLAVAHARPGRPVLYVATGQATDDDMAARIDTHRARRDDRFQTIEAGAELVAALQNAPLDQPALVDALGSWVAADPAIAVDVEGLVAALQARRGPTIVVSDEVGLGVHPSTDVGRRFRDALGHLNQAIGTISDRCLLVVAGRVLTLPSVADHLADHLADHADRLPSDRGADPA